MIEHPWIESPVLQIKKRRKKEACENWFKQTENQRSQTVLTLKPAAPPLAHSPSPGHFPDFHSLSKWPRALSSHHNPAALLVTVDARKLRSKLPARMQASLLPWDLHRPLKAAPAHFSGPSPGSPSGTPAL